MWTLGAAVAVLLASLGGPASAGSSSQPSLQAILGEAKFLPSVDYTGADTAEDLEPLRRAVDSAVSDIIGLPLPRDESGVRTRLVKLIGDTDSFATEDRDQVYRYAVRIWRAAGFRKQSGLFAVPDEKVLHGGGGLISVEGLRPPAR